MIEFMMNHQWSVATALIVAAILLVDFTNRDPNDGYKP